MKTVLMLVWFFATWPLILIAFIGQFLFAAVKFGWDSGSDAIDWMAKD